MSNLDVTTVPADDLVPIGAKTSPGTVPTQLYGTGFEELENRGPFLLTWFNFNPSMDKYAHTR